MVTLLQEEQSNKKKKKKKKKKKIKKLFIFALFGCDWAKGNWVESIGPTGDVLTFSYYFG